MPVWMVDAGLISVDSRFSWEDTAAVLKELASFASALIVKRHPELTPWRHEELTPLLVKLMR